MSTNQPTPLGNSIDAARAKIGELFLIGFQGLDLEDDTSAFISQAGIGGVVLFNHNYESPAQVAELTNQIQECRGDLPLWICTDHEGGRVQRLKKPFTKLCEAGVIGASDSAKLVYELSEAIAKELKAVGVNVNFAPVADILTNPKNTVIGVRAYGSDEEHVSKMVTAWVRGHLVGGVQPCVKHFPGHGDTSVDSHLALPKVTTPLETLMNREFKPFVRAFKSRCQMVMTAHILSPGVDPDFPATLSKKWIADILRTQLRYSRLVITDDMEMKAITDHYGAADAPWMAIAAGCDLLCYRSENAARKAYEAVTKALEDGKLSPEAVLNAAERSRSIKKEVLMPYAPAIIAEVGKKVGLPETLAMVQRFEEMARKQ